jgi:hypothetical protein
MIARYLAVNMNGDQDVNITVHAQTKESVTDLMALVLAYLAISTQHATSLALLVSMETNVKETAVVIQKTVNTVETQMDIVTVCLVFKAMIVPFCVMLDTGDKDVEISVVVRMRLNALLLMAAVDVLQDIKELFVIFHV